MVKRQLKNYIKDLKNINPHINPNKLKVGDVYHVPPIISISRMDIVITSTKDKEKIGFKIVGTTNDKEEKIMDKTSILTKFLIPKKTF